MMHLFTRASVPEDTLLVYFTCVENSDILRFNELKITFINDKELFEELDEEKRCGNVFSNAGNGFCRHETADGQYQRHSYFLSENKVTRKYSNMNLKCR